jgi:photosystem II stability/assembly factor-like uncharacterized protein
MRALSSLTAVLFLLVVAPAGAAVSTSHSGWFWGTPEPQGHSLHALDLEGTTGYAAGDFGTLLRTNDGGTGWGAVRTGERLDYREVDIIDSDSIVVASQCAVRRTDDGGATFRRLPFTTSERGCARTVEALSFPTEDVGFLVLGDGGVLRTNDGGRSFASKPVQGAGGRVSDVMFRNATEGIAVTAEGNVFKTVDGGDSWTLRFDGNFELRAVFFTGTEAVAVGHQTFVTSADGGDTWTRQSPEAIQTLFDEAFNDVRCASPTTCLMTTPSNELVRTADGGQSYTVVVGNNALAVDFASATRAVVVGFGGQTRISDDGGASFVQVGTRLDNAFTRVRALSTDVALAVGGAGALARTVDGGETWTHVGVPTGASVRDIWFATQTLGYALDETGGFFRTENGGGSWSILDTRADQPPSGVFAPDDSNVYLIGPRGVLRSSDGGESFDRHTHRVVRNRTLVEADKAGSDVVFFGPRVIALSTNDGKTWRQIPRPTARAEVAHVDFMSSRVGYVLETDGRVYRTRNRGASWTELIGTGYSNGTRLAFGTARNGWLALRSSHPTALRTTDGGKSWTPQDLGPSPLDSIAAAGSQTGFATFSSSILFTQGGGDAGADSTLRLSTADRTVPRGAKIEIIGRLSPAEGGEDVEVQARRLTGRNWREIDVTPTRAGRFVIEQRIRRPMVFVAQWEGDANSDGDATGPLLVQVGG